MIMKIINYSVDPAVSILKSMLHPHNKGRLQSLVTRYCRLLNHLAKYNGESISLEFAKQLSNNVKRVALGLHVTYTYPIPIRTDDCGLPTQLRLLRKFAKSNSPVLKATAMSISNLYRVAFTDPKPSYSEVLDPFKGDYGDRYYEFLEFIRDNFVPKYRPLFDRAIKHREDFDPQEPSVLLTGSPSGPRSEDAADRDAVRLKFGPDSHIWESVSRLYRAFDAHHKLENLSSLADLGRSYPTGIGLGTYEFIPQKGGKTRGITMGNYFIQDSLKPIHDDFMFVLSKMRQDFTYKQDRVVHVLRAKLMRRLGGYCYDMSGATNRFPSNPQSYLLHCIYGKPIAFDWERLMKLPLTHKSNVLTFAVGQPMGLYSSFPVFSMTHHALVQFCCHKHNVDPEQAYILLGDDIVIFHRRVAATYREFLVKVLGVKVSEHKSILSNTSIKCAEFCKRILLYRSEITGLGSGLICGCSAFDITSLASRIKLFSAWSRGLSDKQLLRSSHTTIITNLKIFFKKEYDKAILGFLIYILGQNVFPKQIERKLMEAHYITPEFVHQVRRIYMLESLGSLAKEYLTLPVKQLDNLVVRRHKYLAECNGGLLHPKAQTINVSVDRVLATHRAVTAYCRGSRVLELSKVYQYLRDIDDQVLVCIGLLNSRKGSKVSLELKRQETVRLLSGYAICASKMYTTPKPDSVVSKVSFQKVS
jgi:hypothetical protein